MAGVPFDKNSTACVALSPSLPSLAFGFERVLQLQSRVPLPLPFVSPPSLSLSPHDPLMKAAADPSPIGRRRAPRGRGQALPLADGEGETRRRSVEKRALQVEGAHRLTARHCTGPPILKSRNMTPPKGLCLATACITVMVREPHKPRARARLGGCHFLFRVAISPRRNDPERLCSGWLFH